MATPEQVEAVARAELEADYRFSESPYEMMPFDDYSPHSQRRMLNQATAAIAAYEATLDDDLDEDTTAAVQRIEATVLPDGSAIWVKSRIKGVDPETDLPYRIFVPSRWQPADAVRARLEGRGDE